MPKTLECSPLNARVMNCHSINALYVLRQIQLTTSF